MLHQAVSGLPFINECLEFAFSVVDAPFSSISTSFILIYMVGCLEVRDCVFKRDLSQRNIKLSDKAFKSRTASVDILLEFNQAVSVGDGVSVDLKLW